MRFFLIDRNSQKDTIIIHSELEVNMYSPLSVVLVVAQNHMEFGEHGPAIVSRAFQESDRQGHEQGWFVSVSVHVIFAHNGNWIKFFRSEFQRQMSIHDGLSRRNGVSLDVSAWLTALFGDDVPQELSDFCAMKPAVLGSCDFASALGRHVRERGVEWEDRWCEFSVAVATQRMPKIASG